MSSRRTFADADRYIFTTTVDNDGLPTFVTVHWSALPFAPTEAFLAPLRAYLSPRHEVSEVWFVFPHDLQPLHETLSQSERMDITAPAPTSYRFFMVLPDGTLKESLRAPEATSTEPTETTWAPLLQDGLRQLFRDTDALAIAAAGYHFTHPGGAHSEQFIRASQAASRTNHAYFIAMTLLQKLAPVEADSTIWTDTAGIAPVAYALVDLLRRNKAAGERRVESFIGYDGLSTQLQATPNDIILISGSTSGTLARKVIAEKKVVPGQVATLFFLSEQEPPTDAGVVLCDLSNRDNVAHPSVRESRILPYKTYRADACHICDIGSGEIRLEGDSFFPSTSQLDLRMPSVVDRPLGGKTGTRDRVLEFDGHNYFEDLVGHDAITFTARDPQNRSPHGVSTSLGHLLDPENPNNVSEKILAEARIAVEKAPPVGAVLSLLDDDSTTLGQFLAREFLGEDIQDNLTETSAPWREWRIADTLEAAAQDRTILVCAAVVGSGRQLTAVSRELRSLPGDFNTEYVTAAAHPESATTWDMLSRTLERVSPTHTSRLRYVWRLPREPRFPNEKTPWARERNTLERVGTWLTEDGTHEYLVTSLENRLGELARLDSTNLFVGATGAIKAVNPGFALWPFDWTKRPGTHTPTHAEIYATVAHLLYESRRRHPRVDTRSVSARRHGYALHPAVFDRFNDPIIQAAILRTAEPGELHYTTSEDGSRAVADLIHFVLSNIGNQSGDAAYEFALALCEGCQQDDAPGMRIHPRWLRSVLRELEDPRSHGADFVALKGRADAVRALLLYLRTQTAVTTAGHG